MSDSAVECNRLVHQAYYLLQEGSLSSAARAYEQALTSQPSPRMEDAIRCSWSVVLYSMGQYERSMKAVAPLVEGQRLGQAGVVGVRVLVNLCLIEAVEGQQQRALDYFSIVMEMVGSEPHQSKTEMARYVTYLLFRVESLDELKEAPISVRVSGLGVCEVWGVFVKAFNSWLVSQKVNHQLLIDCYQQTLKHQRYELCLFMLRSIQECSASDTKAQQFCQKQLGKLSMLGYLSSSIDYHNFEPYHTLVQIAQQLKKLTPALHKSSKKSQLSPAICKCIVSLMRREVQGGTNRKQVLAILDSMQHETNSLILQFLTKHPLYQQYQFKVHQKVKEMFEGLHRKYTLTCKQALDKLNTSTLPSLTPLVQVHRPRPSHDKENLGISVVTVTSHKQQKRSRIFGDEPPRKLSKMVRMIEHGTFLNKRNFNSEGGEFRFVRIDSGFIKWGKDPQRIQESCQIYPLKDIRSIVYGRVTPNLNQHYNRMLQYSKCFSLLLHARTLDFYAQKHEELEAWVCGLSHVLHKRGQPVVGYSPAKLRWKKLFATLREHFTEPLKMQQRNCFSNETAYAVILFGRNGCRLPGGHGSDKHDR